MVEATKVCEQIEREAMENGHDIGEGFYDAVMFSTKMYRMDCSRCNFFAVVSLTGRYLKSCEGRCDGQYHQGKRDN